jgi:hypothetical protein
MFFYAQQIQPRALKGASATTAIGRMERLKLLHMQALSRIANGLAIKMKIAQHTSIGGGYGPIGRKYWTIWTRSFNLKEPIGRWHLRVVASVLQDARSR